MAFWFWHCIGLWVDTNIFDELAASIFMVTEFCLVDAEVIQRKKWVDNVDGLHIVWPVRRVLFMASTPFITVILNLTFLLSQNNIHSFYPFCVCDWPDCVQTTYIVVPIPFCKSVQCQRGLNSITLKVKVAHSFRMYVLTHNPVWYQNRNEYYLINTHFESLKTYICLWSSHFGEYACCVASSKTSCSKFLMYFLTLV
jgi:hypothetical protein